MSETKTRPNLPCLCASLRRAARAVTQRYDEALRRAGLRATQFTLLQALSRAGALTQGDLGDLLALDSTTLTRTLEILRRRGWIAKRQGDDRRERRLSLTHSGEARLRRALPHWEKVQAQMRHRLGSKRFKSLLGLSDKVTTAAMEGGTLQ